MPTPTPCNACDWSRRKTIPVVQNASRVQGPVLFSPRIMYPTEPPTPSPRSSATRWATPVCVCVCF